jgi:hypothetical protein
VAQFFNEGRKIPDFSFVILAFIAVTIVPPVTIEEHLDDLKDDLKDLEHLDKEPCMITLVSPFEFPIQEDDIADDC